MTPMDAQGSSASTMPARGYGRFWRDYSQRQGVEYPNGRPLRSELEQRVEALELELLRHQTRDAGNTAATNGQEHD